MKFRSTDPDIATLITRIKDGDLKLQPDFQRGEIWSLNKKKKLIDTLLRGWQIPPIHVIEVESSNSDEVLDGQQRLVAIRDFFDNKFKIDGNIEPYNEEILELDGQKFEDLEEKIVRKLKKAPIRVFTLIEYQPEETAELFYRLNQPATLTSAEQRNAFYGKSRNQIKELVLMIDNSEELKKTIGFSNSRMAYDDIISKFCFSLEKESIKTKLTSNDIAQKYREKDGFDASIIEKAKEIISIFINIIRRIDINLRLNKATVFSWLCFISRYNNEISNQFESVGSFIESFESYRKYIKNGAVQFNIFSDGGNYFYSENSERLILLFNQKCSMGSTDASSIMIRDVILWLFYYNTNLKHTNDIFKIKEKMSRLNNRLSVSENISSSIEDFIKSEDWGDLI